MQQGEALMLADGTGFSKHHAFRQILRNTLFSRIDVFQFNPISFLSGFTRPTFFTQVGWSDGMLHTGVICWSATPRILEHVILDKHLKPPSSVSLRSPASLMEKSKVQRMGYCKVTVEIKTTE
ncbi:MAG TPA: hypothetical protein PKK82_04400 [Anaerolineaceae bacterium]|nr:hypothetical protein [Anaerolineaceae bacterium]